MAKVIGVRFRETGKIYYFDPGTTEIRMNDYVLVETARGREIGQVRMAPREIPDDEVVAPLKSIQRKADDEDIARMKANREKEKEAFRICKKKIREHGLEMKLVDAEYTFDNNKLLFYFTADGRVDFRDLVKDLAGTFHIRIELRQIGVRDETRIMGGLGPCGRELCCKSWLTDFVPVSIKMAKEQNLSLNPTKISGVCGRLMCCLKNEQESYEYLNAQMPRVGAYITTPDGMQGRVQNVNVLRQTIKVVVENNDEKEIREYTADELSGNASEKPAEGASKKTGEGGRNGNDRGARSDHGNERSDRGDRSGRKNNRRDNANNRGKNQNQNHGNRNKNNRNGQSRENGQNRENSQNRENGQNRNNDQSRENSQNRENVQSRNNRGRNQNRRNNNRNRNGENGNAGSSGAGSSNSGGHVRGGYSSGYASDQPKE